MARYTKMTARGRMTLIMLAVVAIAAATYIGFSNRASVEPVKVIRDTVTITETKKVVAEKKKKTKKEKSDSTKHSKQAKKNKKQSSKPQIDTSRKYVGEGAEL